MISSQEIQLPEEIAFFTKDPVSMRSIIDKKRDFFIIKRIFDIVISLMVSLIFLSWLFPLVAILIFLESRGPVLFVQRRVGMGGRTFRCLKFRTMVLNSDANTKQAQVNDRRITRVGQFLRVSNLDEFPQFINVLVGDMSIVGPRPHMHSDCSKFSTVVNGYKFRNMVKPGITGLAQVKGYRGPTKDFASIFNRYQFDAFYVRNANFWLDIRIIKKTASQTIMALVKKIAGKSEPRPFFQRKWVMAVRTLLS